MTSSSLPVKPPEDRKKIDPPVHSLVNPIFTEKQCNQIILMAHAVGFEPAVVGWGEGRQSEKRTNTVSLLGPSPQTQWIYETITRCVDWANEENYRFNILNCEGIQINRYLPTKDSGQHYTWHHDDLLAHVDEREQRKLSFVCLLNSKDEFTGGILESDDPYMQDQTDENCMMNAAGQVSIFPSWLRHRVTPVTQGFRYSLVTWFNGPRWM